MMSTQQKTDVNVISVENNSYSCIALDDEGRVWTWGNNNDEEQLGRACSGVLNRVNPYNRGGQVTETVDPDQDLPYILQISGSYQNSLALDRDGNVWSWGLTSRGALGRVARNGRRPGKVEFPEKVEIKWIAAAFYGGKAIDSNGNIWVWGEGEQSNLGNGSNSDISVPEKLTLDSDNNPLPTNFKMISSSDFSGRCAAIAVTEDGRIFTWGNTADATRGGASRPRQTGFNADIKKIDVGNGNYGFLTHSGEIWTWGDNKENTSGRQGHGDTDNRATPKKIESVVNGGTIPAPKFRDFSIYAWSMCAVDHEGNLYASGADNNNKHGTSGTPRVLTKYVLPKEVPEGTKILIVAEGYYSTSHVDIYGNAYVTGDSTTFGINNNDGSPEGRWVHFNGSGKPLFTSLSSTPPSEAKRYNTSPRTTLNAETNIASDEVKYVIIYPDDDETYTDGERFYDKSFAEIEPPYYLKGTDPQLLLSPNYDLWSSRYYANPKISEEVFNAVYSMKDATDKGTMDVVDGAARKVFTKADLVSFNCIVWIQSKNSFGTTRVIYRFDNYYTQTKAWFDGVKFDDTQFSLYPPELVGGGYGLFLDQQGNLIPGDPPFGYDIVKPVPNELTYWTLSPANQLDEEKAPDGYIHRVDRSKEVFLTELSQKGDDTTKTPRVTFTYVKNPLMWVKADLHFVNESGEGVDVKIEGVAVQHETREMFAPKGAEHVQGQEPYIPPEAVNPQTRVIGYSLTMPDGSEGSYTKADFPSGFKPKLEEYSTIYIVYASGVVTVTERFIDISDNGNTAISNNSGMMSTEKNLKQGTENYDFAGPMISDYVIVGHETVIGGNTVRTDYQWDVDHYVQENAFIGGLADNAQVRFLYKSDRNGNKIPDDEEGRVQVRWIAVNANNSAHIIAQETVCGNGKKGDTVTIYEDKDNVLPTAQYDPRKWLFRPGQDEDISGPYSPKGGGISESVTLSAGSVENVYFYFDENYNENEIADKLEGHFTEKYKLASTRGDLTPPKADTTSKWLGGQNYSETAPLITGYVSVGYVIESENMEPIVKGVERDQTGNVTVDFEIPFENTEKNYTVTLLYKKDENQNNIPDDEEGQVTVKWIGTTFAGNSVELAKLVINGYIGDDVTDMINPPSRFDDIWKLTGSNIPDEIILSAQPQEYIYEYSEVPEFSTITIETKSTDGSLDFFYLYTKKLTDEEFDVTAFAIPTYRVKSYVHYDNYGNEIQSGTADTVKIDPSIGSQRIVFNYESTTTTLVIRAVDAQDSNVLQSTTITDAVIGQKYSATAPYVDDTWVLLGEVIQVINVKAGTNYITFEYEKATGNVTILLKERDGENERIIRVLSETLGHGDKSEIVIPNLSDAYYTQIDTQAQMVDYTGAEPVPNPVVYYYSKDMMDVTVKAVDESNGGVLKSESHTASARKGESYTAAAPIVEWYTLSESISKSVYVDPDALDDTISVEFAYKKDSVGNIIVRSFYKDKDGVEIELESYEAQGLVGSKFTAISGGFPGMKLADEETNAVQIIIDADDDKNTIEFEYIDLRKTIGVSTQIVLKPETRVQISEVKYPSESDVTLIPPYMSNHLVVGYIIDEQDMEPVEPEMFASLVIESEDVIDGMSIVFVYKPFQKIVDDRYVDVTIRGITGAVTHYSYVKRIARSELTKTLAVPADVFDVPGYVLDGAADFDVAEPTDDEPIVKTFNYNSLATTLTIRMVDGTGAEVAKSFAVAATAGAPFTYNAPNVPEYYLAGGSLGLANPVLAGGESEIVFTYERIASKVTIVAKENDSNGRIISVFEVSDPQAGANEYDVPDLTADYYTANQPKVEITFDGTNSVSAEAYYTKDLADVEREALNYMTGVDLGMQAPLVNQRKGEAVTVSAPDIADYVLVGSAAQIIIADGANKAVFKYRNLESDEVSVKAVDDAGSILQSYILKGDVGETVSAQPPVIAGWKTDDIEKSAIIGTDSEIVFSYAKNVVTVTVNVADAEGTVMSSTVAEVPMGGGYTAYAPHIAGYVIDGSATHVFENLVANETVTFVVIPVEAAVVKVMVIGNSADGELYGDIFLRSKNSGAFKVTARDVDEYRPIGAASVTVNIGDEDAIVIFEYESIYTTVSIYKSDEDSGEMIAAFYDGALTGGSYSFNALNISGYNLTSESATVTVSPVLPNGASEINFTYKK